MPVTKEDMKALWAKVQENTRTLDACTGPHHFECLTPDRLLGSRWRCRLCGGEVALGDKGWYDRGLAHGHASAKSDDDAWQARALTLSAALERAVESLRRIATYSEDPKAQAEAEDSLIPCAAALGPACHGTGAKGA